MINVRENIVTERRRSVSRLLQYTLGVGLALALFLAVGTTPVDAGHWHRGHWHGRSWYGGWYGSSWGYRGWGYGPGLYVGYSTPGWGWGGFYRPYAYGWGGYGYPYYGTYANYSFPTTVYRWGYPYAGYAPPVYQYGYSPGYYLASPAASYGYGSLSYGNIYGSLSYASYATVSVAPRPGISISYSTPVYSGVTYNSFGYGVATPFSVSYGGTTYGPYATYGAFGYSTLGCGCY
jgi:hypothetical protein